VLDLPDLGLRAVAHGAVQAGMVGVDREIVRVVIRPFLMGLGVKNVCRGDLNVTVFVK
jgi:hypothetical protein